MAVMSEVITCFSRKRIFGYNFVALASIGIAVLGFLVWAHHLFVAGISAYAALVFSLLSYFVAVPSAIKVFNWTATMYKGQISVFHADALCVRFHRPVHDGRHDGTVPGQPRHSTFTLPTLTS